MIVHKTKIKRLLNAVQNLKCKNIFVSVSSPKKQQIQRLKNHKKKFCGFKKDKLKLVFCSAETSKLLWLKKFEIYLFKQLQQIK